MEFFCWYTAEYCSALRLQWVGFFVLGFSLAMWILSSQPITIRLLVSLVVGGILALVGYLLMKLVLHLAGGLLGAVLALLILSLLPISLPSFLVLILIIVGAGLFFRLRSIHRPGVSGLCYFSCHGYPGTI